MPVNTTRTIAPAVEDVEPEDVFLKPPAEDEEAAPAVFVKPPLPPVQSERNRMKVALDAQPKKSIYLPSPPYSKIAGKIVQINEYNYPVPVGVLVEVPESVYQILTEQMQADQMDHNLSARADGTFPESFG